MSQAKRKRVLPKGQKEKFGQDYKKECFKSFSKKMGPGTAREKVLNIARQERRGPPRKARQEQANQKTPG